MSSISEHHRVGCNSHSQSQSRLAWTFPTQASSQPLLCVAYSACILDSWVWLLVSSNTSQQSPTCQGRQARDEKDGGGKRKTNLTRVSNSFIKESRSHRCKQAPLNHRLSKSTLVPAIKSPRRLGTPTRTDSTAIRVKNRMSTQSKM